MLYRLDGTEELLPDETGDDSDQCRYRTAKYQPDERCFGGGLTLWSADYSFHDEQQRSQDQDDAGDANYGWAKHAKPNGSIEFVDLVWVLAWIAVCDVHSACVWLSDHRYDASV